ncbi:hypothetical protein ACS0TY_029800 [Phlomoides rotata]
MVNDVFNQYASYITGESERPAFTNVNANNDRESTRGVDDIPCDVFGPNDPPHSEPEDDEGYLDDEDHPFEGHVPTIGHVQPQSAAHPSLSRASFFVILLLISHTTMMWEICRREWYSQTRINCRLP